MAAAIRRALRAVNVVGDVAGTSSEACAMLADTAYDAVVLDAMLPDADGFATCRRLRAPVTGRQSSWSLDVMKSMNGLAGLDAGADDYLSKPFAFGDLLAEAPSGGGSRSRRATGDDQGRFPATQPTSARRFGEAGKRSGCRPASSRCSRLYATPWPGSQSQPAARRRRGRSDMSTDPT